LAKRRTLWCRRRSSRPRELRLLRAHGLRWQRARATEHSRRGRPRRRVRAARRLCCTAAWPRRCLRPSCCRCRGFSRSRCRRSRRRLHDTRLSDRWTLRRRERPRRLWCPAWFFDPEANRRRNEASGWRWRSNLWRRCRDRHRRLFDYLFDDRRFFDWRSFGHSYDRGGFFDFDMRWWFDLDNWWRRDNGDRLFNWLLDNRRRRGRRRRRSHDLRR
jgi:hypothetical protein